MAVIKYLCEILFLTLILTACQNDKHRMATQTKGLNSNKYFQEDHRPQFHFSPPQMWMNDPNGMVYFDGEYHLFYQFYPDSTVWGPMHWGHAVSENLVHWQHLPIGLYPDSLGYIFSGSAVVDWNNTSGFGKNGEPPLIAVFTQHDPLGEKAGEIDFQYQSIAYSNDKGRTWIKFEGNPVIPNPGIKDFRDPKVIWDENSRQWIMVFAAGDHLKFYGSADLIKWTKLSEFGKEWGSHGGVWECPDLFPITVEDTEEKKWALLLSINPGGPNGGSGTQYFIGEFDGSSFLLDEGFANDVSEENAVWLDWGRDNYAGVTWSDIPKEDGRRIFMGWMSNWDYAQVVPTANWRSAMTLPRELVLEKTSEGLRLFSRPMRELLALRENHGTVQTENPSGSLEIGCHPAQMELYLEFHGDLTVELLNTKGDIYQVGYDATANEFFSDRTRSGKLDFSSAFAVKNHTAARISKNELVSMHLFFDVASVELFADGGATAITDVFFPNEAFNNARLKYGGKIIKADCYELKGVW